MKNLFQFGGKAPDFRLLDRDNRRRLPSAHIWEKVKVKGRVTDVCDAVVKSCKRK
jgi:hypothetical protein